MEKALKKTPWNEPFSLFSEWFSLAKELPIRDPNAMCLATSTADGHPSARIVLLKGVDERGFSFFTNLTSRKGRELKENPHASLLFYWEPLGKQIRIEGKIERVSEKEADDYFASRARGSQLGAWASKQSTAMTHENELADRLKEITTQFEAQPIARPPFWSGFRLVPERIEFWQEGEYRLHTRLLYCADGKGGWNVNKLFP